jgi:PAS domain S-box-containing protein
VTERKQAEEQILFRARLLEQVQAAIIATNLEGTVTHWNEYAEKLYGWSREEVLGRNITELIVSPARAEAANEIMERLRAGETWEDEFEVQRKDGTVFPAHVADSLIYDAQGRVTGIISVSTDITERKKAEEERERFFALSPDLLCIAGLDGYFKRINPAFEETLGYTTGELLAKPFVEFVHPDDHAATLGELEKLGTGSPSILFENRYRCKDDSYVWLAWKAVPVVEEGLVYAAARNVTAQRWAEQEVRIRARQQEAVADLGKRALAEPDLSALMDETVSVVARTLGLECCNVLELLPGGDSLLLRSGAGWGKELVGKATVRANLDYQAGYTLLSDEPVVVEDLRTEVRFSGPPMLREHGVVSSMTTIIRGRERPFGVLEAYTKERRTFTQDDVNFLRAVANVLAEAIERNSAEEDLRNSELMARSTIDSLSAHIAILDESGTIVGVNEAWRRSGRTNSSVMQGLAEGTDYLSACDSATGPGAEDAAAFADGIRSVLYGLQEDFELEYPCHSPDEWCWFVGKVTRFPDTCPPRVVVVHENISERKRAEKQMNEVREAERSRIARDLHDEALQDLVCALQEVRTMQTLSGAGDGLEELAGSLRRSVEGLRAAIYDLRLGGDREQTFTEMLETLVELNRRNSPDREIELSVEDGFHPPFSRTKEIELLRILQEALANVRRHSGAHRVRVAVGVSVSKLWAEVSDDGEGFDPTEEHGGMGTRGMRERARALGGDLEIKSKPGQGTKVRFEVALRADGEKPEKETRILLVEDHAAFRQGVATAFEREPGFAVVAQVGSLAAARQVLDGVEVALVDLALPDGFGGDLVKELREANPQVQVLVLSATLDRAEIAWAVEAGAAGAIHKSAKLEEIVEAVRLLREGETLLSPQEAVELLRLAGSRRETEHEARQTVALLTPREKEVLQALADGLDSKESAERLNISVETERNHMARILAKLGVHSRLQALVLALRHGVVSIC